MGINYPSIGEGYVPAYSISAIPYVTSSQVSLGEVKTIKFDYVTRFLTVKNTGPSSSVISVGFTENGLKPVNSNFFFLSGSEFHTAEFRTDRVFISGSAGSPTFTVIAGLTYVRAREFMEITGSNGYGGVG